MRRSHGLWALTLAVASCAAIGCAEGSGDLYDPAEEDGSAGSTQTPKRPARTRKLWLDWDFTTGLEGWAIDYAGTGDDPAPELQLGSTLEAISDVDGASGGALKLTAPIDRADQKVQLSVKLPVRHDMRGTVAVARARLASAFGVGDALGGVLVFAKSSYVDFVYSNGGWVSITEDMGWTEVTMDFDAPGYPRPGSNIPVIDPENVVEIGLQIASGGTGEYQGAELLIDRVWVEVPEPLPSNP
jgi:hypothetical protein